MAKYSAVDLPPPSCSVRQWRSVITGDDRSWLSCKSQRRGYGCIANDVRITRRRRARGRDPLGPSASRERLVTRVHAHQSGSFWRLGLLYVMTPSLVLVMKNASWRIDHLIGPNEVGSRMKTRRGRDWNWRGLWQNERAARIRIRYHRRCHRWRHLCRRTGYKQ